MEILVVAVGAGMGSLTRFVIGKAIADRLRITLPIGTFFINITGAILLGMLTSVNIEGNLFVFMGDGFLGAYTTFSTFMYEGFTLFQESELLNALVYIVGSIIIGIIGFMLGYFIF